jgi:hypothetical protein
MMLSWQKAPLNGVPRFARSIAVGSLTATAIVSHSELGWSYRVYRTDSGLFEEHLFHAGHEITPSRVHQLEVDLAVLQRIVKELADKVAGG